MAPLRVSTVCNSLFFHTRDTFQSNSSLLFRCRLGRLLGDIFFKTKQVNLIQAKVLARCFLHLRSVNEGQTEATSTCIQPAVMKNTESFGAHEQLAAFLIARRHGRETRTWIKVDGSSLTIPLFRVLNSFGYWSLFFFERCHWCNALRFPKDAGQYSPPTTEWASEQWRDRPSTEGCPCCL